MDKLRGSGYERLPPKSRRTSNPIRWLAIILALLGFLFAALNHFNIKVQIVSAQTEEGVTIRFLSIIQKLKIPVNFRAPLPTLFATHPPEPDSPGFKDAALALDALLSARTAASDIDSLSIAVVGPNGPIFERGYGVLRANESDTQNSGSVTKDSIYRIASITKMFTTLETLILRERGALNWDDPVTKFLPNFTYPSYGWAEFLNGDALKPNQEAPITLRQLASHLSGIGRDYPPQDVGETWPAPFPEGISSRKLVQRSQGETPLLDAVAKYPLVAPQFTFPVYSNTGFDVLGLSDVAAHALSTGKETNFRELMQRDIFEPLGMTSSFYEIPDESLAAKMAIPASYSDWADYTFEPDNDPSGGQYSSLSDLMTVMQSFLSPNETGVISPYVLREWLRPMHAWSDGFYEVGAPWEMIKVGKEARAYAKGGNLPGYHSQFVVNPQWSYGVIVLVTGNYTDTATLAQEAIAQYQPAFENLLLARALDAYGGVWIGDGSVAIVVIQDGALFLQALFVHDQDVLALLQSGLSGKPPAPNPKPVALWSTGRPHEFRLAIGRPELNELPTAGCEPYWISLDLPFSRGAPLDLLYWDGSDLVYPSAGVRLQRL